MSASVPLKILVIGDGYNKFGINFQPQQDTTDCSFTVTEFLYLLQNASRLAVSVDTASRDPDPSADFQNFVFSDLSLAKYGAVWLFGYDGLDDFQTTPIRNSQPVSDAERLAIFSFMNRGGGVFATGDHSGLGSFMCGNLPRVRSMRKWFSRLTDCPPDRTTAIDLHGKTVSMVNWSGLSGSPNSGLPRLDTLRGNASDTPDVFDFDNQSDSTPQELVIWSGGHFILNGSQGWITRFPDHMHEGEVVVPAHNLQMTIGSQGFAEFPPTPQNTYPMPVIVAATTALANHTVKVSSKRDCGFSGDGTPSVGSTYGAICVYDGWPAQVGRIVTDASFHHYLDLNLVGNPNATTVDRQHGFGQGFERPDPASVLGGLQEFYSNVAAWLSRPPAGLACSNQFGVDGQTDVLVADVDGNLMVHWDGPDDRWNGPAALSGSGLFVPGGGVTLAQRAAIPDQTDAFAIDTTGAIKVWSAVGSGHWQATDSIAPGTFTPGGHVAVSPQFGVAGQTDVFSVDVNGQIRVAWAGNGSWHQPPGRIWSPENFPPGAPLVALNRFGVADQTDLYTINNMGTLFALSVNGTGA